MIYVYAILNVIVYIYKSFLINFTNKTIAKNGITTKATHKNMATMNGAITFKRENIDSKKNIAIIPRKTNTTINIFFNKPTPSIRAIISRLQRFCKYSVLEHKSFVKIIAQLYNKNHEQKSKPKKYDSIQCCS